jgi:hypothetical protein
MPADWDLPRSSGLWSQQDIANYNRLPVQMAMQQNRKMQMWSRWKNLFPKIKFKQNMGDIIMGVIAENSPIVSQVHRPKNITELPNKTVASTWERTNSSRVKRHNFESYQFNFLPSFRDFRTKQLKFAAEDLAKQIAVGFDFFVRDNVFQNSPFVYIVNNSTVGERPLINAVAAMPTDTTAVKDDAWVAAMAAKIGSGENGFLSYRQLQGVASYAKNYQMIFPYEGMKDGAPADNELVKGRYVLVGGSEIYEGLAFDEHVLNTKPLAMNLLNSSFSGPIGPNLIFKEEFYPLRFAADGSMPDPEIELLLPDSGYSTTNANRQTVINPAYATAPIGVAFLLGYNAYEALEVGPPPAEFAGASISGQRFNKLSWNGEVRMTDNVLVNYGSGNLDTNKYGEFLQLIADTTLGIIANTARNAIPILYRRQIAPSLVSGSI